MRRANFVVAWLIGLVARIYFRFEVRGAGNVPKTGPVLLVANHASNLDPPLLAAASPRLTHFLAKQEVFSIPFIGWFSRRIGHAHPINRERMDRTALRTCAEVLKNEEALAIFPEGTRTSDGKLQPAKPGVALIASAAAATIVPVYIDGSYEALGRGKSFPRPHKIRITFGPAFKIEDAIPDASRSDRHKVISEQIMSSIAAVGEQAGVRTINDDTNTRGYPEA